MVLFKEKKKKAKILFVESNGKKNPGESKNLVDKWPRG